MAEAHERQTKEDDGALCGMSWSAACRKTPVVESLDVRKKWRAVCLQRGQHGSEGDARVHPRGVTASTLHSASVLCGHLARASDNGVGINRMPAGRGIVSEAKVCGKATG